MAILSRTFPDCFYERMREDGFTDHEIELAYSALMDVMARDPAVVARAHLDVIDREIDLPGAGAA